MAKTKQAEREPEVEQQIEVEPPKGAQALTTVTPRIDAFIAQVLPQASRERLFGSLPSHIRPEVFERNLFNAVATNPWLLNYSPALIFREVSKCAGLGLLLDPILGEAYLIEGYNGKTRRTEPQLRVGYKGMNKLARQSGNVAGLWCHEIHKEDKVVVDLGFPKVFHHNPVLFGERGPIIGYAATIAYKDGTFDFEPISLVQCLEIRDRSDAYKAFKAEKIKSTPWVTDQNEMCKKTGFRRLMKRQDQSPQMRAAIQIEDEAEFPHMIPHEPGPELHAPAPPPPDPSGTSGGDPAGATDVRRRAPAPAVIDQAPQESESPAPPDEVTTVAMSAKELFAFVQQRCDAITAEAFANDPDVFDALWNIVIEPLLEGRQKPDVEEVQGIFNLAVKRLSP